MDVEEIDVHVELLHDELHGLSASLSQPVLTATVT
jgi:hypothetical protein